MTALVIDVTFKVSVVYISPALSIDIEKIPVEKRSHHPHHPPSSGTPPESGGPGPHGIEAIPPDASAVGTPEQLSPAGKEKAPESRVRSIETTSRKPAKKATKASVKKKSFQECVDEVGVVIWGVTITCSS